MNSVQALEKLKSLVGKTVSINRDNYDRGGIGVQLVGQLMMDPDDDNCWSVVFDRGFHGLVSVDFTPPLVLDIYKGGLLTVIDLR